MLKSKSFENLKIEYFKIFEKSQRFFFLKKIMNGKTKVAPFFPSFKLAYPQESHPNFPNSFYVEIFLRMEIVILF